MRRELKKRPQSRATTTISVERIEACKSKFEKEEQDGNGASRITIVRAH